MTTRRAVATRLLATAAGVSAGASRAEAKNSIEYAMEHLINARNQLAAGAPGDVHRLKAIKLIMEALVECRAGANKKEGKER